MSLLHLSKLSDLSGIVHMPISVHNGQGNYGFTKSVKIVEMPTLTENGFERVKELLINNE